MLGQARSALSAFSFHGTNLSRWDMFVTNDPVCGDVGDNHGRIEGQEKNFGLKWI